MDDDEETQVQSIPGRKFSVMDLVITTLDCFASYVDDVVQLLCAHMNWKLQRKAVADQMRADLESIVGGE